MKLLQWKECQTNKKKNQFYSIVEVYHHKLLTVKVWQLKQFKSRGTYKRNMTLTNLSHQQKVVEKTLTKLSHG